MALYQAIFKSVSGRILTYVVQFLALAIYARLFSPEEFGIVASIQVFVIFFQMLADVGIGPGIINENRISKNQRNGIYSFTALTGIVFALVFYAFSYVLNRFYGGYTYQDIAIIVSIAIFFNAISIVPITAMNKDAKFIHIAIVDICAELIALVVIYTLHNLDFGVLALSVRPLVQSIVKYVFILNLSTKTELGRPSFGSQIYHIKKIMSFSLYQFGFNFINYFSRNLDNILIAKFFGVSKLGIYEKSYQLMRYPLMLTTSAMNPAIQPVLTKVRGNVDVVVDEHIKLSSRLIFISLIISAFMYTNSKEIVYILLGEEWFNVIPLIEIFCFLIPIQSVLSTCGAFFQVMNNTRLLFFSGLISATANVAAISLGVYLGSVDYIAKLLVISVMFNFIQSFYILYKFCFGRSLYSFYIKLLASIFLALPSIVLYWFVLKKVTEIYDFNNVSQLFVSALIGLLALVVFSKPIKSGLFK